jgi:hypothetical protein
LENAEQSPHFHNVHSLQTAASSITLTNVSDYRAMDCNREVDVNHPAKAKKLSLGASVDIQRKEGVSDAGNKQNRQPEGELGNAVDSID